MLKMLTSADVTPKEYSDWYLFNTWLQRKLDGRVHLDIPISVDDLHRRVDNDDVDIIYANPYDAAMLIREKGFVPIARPNNKADEMVIVTSVDNPVEDFTCLQPGCKIALTDDRDVKMIGMILIEPADLNSDNVEFMVVENGVVVAKNVMNGDADIGFILTKSYDTFSHLITDSLRVLIRSQISVINHTIMVKPEVLKQIPNLSDILVDMDKDPAGKQILESFDIDCLMPVDYEEAEFMIDIMDTLK